ncbi:FG-GAP and VCBS repeat-containing protein [Actinocorallia longicatena]|uniref:FG-GAP-like repeat-containing protein n=1 Tax=Actinocorallia longicatena TaxID=111803 RepID=A0ABP6QKX9_9ACTN
MKRTLVVTGVMLASALASPAAHAAAKKPAKAYDFDGNGKPDLALGAPGAKIVAVVYSGRKKKRKRQVTGGRAGFGTSLASADFDRDGYADLAVAGRGAVTVVHGSKSGLGKRRKTLKTSGGTLTRRGLAVGDFDGDGDPDLVATAGPRYWLFENEGGGRFHRTGTTPGGTGPTVITYAPVAGDFNRDKRTDLVLLPDGGPGGEPEIMIAMGSAKGLKAPAGTGLRGGVVGAAGDLDGDGHADLVRGGPAGIQVGYGGRNGFSAGRVLTQDSPGIPGRTAAGTAENFGDALAVGDLDHDGRADLVVGDPDDAAAGTGAPSPGSVTVLFGSRSGLTATGARRLTLDSHGVPARAMARDGFGSALAVLDLAADGRPEIIAGAPGIGQVLTLRLTKRRVTGGSALTARFLTLPTSSRYGTVVAR